MPTPFYHLHVAAELRTHPGLPGPARRLLQDHLGPFLFGNTAPDVQVVSRQERQETHFFSVPLRREEQPPWERILDMYPSLDTSPGQPPACAAFLAGYLCHLQADWLWVSEIFTPVFGPDCGWGTFPERLYFHNVLRSYLDNQVIPGLPGETADCLNAVEPGGWLPFVKDRHLRAWRDYLAEQLQPGAMVKTVEVFAIRQGISPEDFYDLLGSEDRLDREIFIHLPREELHRYQELLLKMNLEVLRSFLAGREKGVYRPLAGARVSQRRA